MADHDPSRLLTERDAEQVALETLRALLPAPPRAYHGPGKCQSCEKIREQHAAFNLVRAALVARDADIPGEEYVNGVKSRVEDMGDGWVRMPVADWHGLFDCLRIAKRLLVARDAELASFKRVLARGYYTRQIVDLKAELAEARAKILSVGKRRVEMESAYGLEVQRAKRAEADATRLRKALDGPISRGDVRGRKTGTDERTEIHVAFTPEEWLALSGGGAANKPEDEAAATVFRTVRTIWLAKLDEGKPEDWGEAGIDAMDTLYSYFRGHGLIEADEGESRPRVEPEAS